MTYKAVDAMVGSIGLPYAYHQFEEGTGQDCPFICWFFQDSNDLYADNTNFQRIRPLVIELYTDNKDFALETQVENAINAAGLAYSRYENYIGAERMYQIIYNMEVVING